MNTEPWVKTCKRCGRSFEVGLWCREVIYCDTCRAELDAVHTDSFDHNLPEQENRPEAPTPNQPETGSGKRAGKLVGK